jgi:hypothetical protein
MRYVIVFIALFVFSNNAYTDELTVKITSLTNVSGNGAMEACGIVENQKNKTSLVTIKHKESSYTTLTDQSGNWCQVIKRWSYNGETDATAREL